MVIQKRRKKLCENKPKYLVSACLAGLRCTYAGSHKLVKNIKKLVENKTAIAICPEVSGGGLIPRKPCEIIGGDGNDVARGRARVITISGEDISNILIKGATNALREAKKNGIKIAILKSNSPSCGFGMIYDGTFSKKLKKGSGVTAAILHKNSISILNEKEFL